MEQQKLYAGREQLVESNVRRIRDFVTKIDSRLEVRRGAPAGQEVVFSGEKTLSALRDDRVYVRAGENIIATFPADEVFTEDEVKTEVLKGLRNMGGQNPINL